MAAFVVEADGIHPLTRQRERHVVDACCWPGEADTLGGLVVRVVASAREDGIDILRVDAGVRGRHAQEILRTFRATGFVEELVVVRKAVRADGDPGGEFMVTPAEHRVFALDCIRLGVANALQAAGSAVEDRFVGRYVARRFGKLTTATQWSILALEASQPRAHALVRLVGADLRRAREAFILDLFVPRPWCGRGWSARLLAFLERLLQQSGIDRMQGTVLQINDPHSADLLRTLRRSGWWAEMQSFVPPLRPG